LAYLSKISIKEKNSGRNATKRNLHRTYARHNLKRYLYLTQKSGFVNTKSRKNVHKYSFSFYLSIILVVTAVIGSDATGIVGKTFSDLITNFSNHANMSVK